ncbi:MAG TPA: hypothetical protein PLQ30_03985 [Rectinema sp.]|jgi:hypothetical protein|nr:hypothetical protein [Rectinema sp.]HPW01636.1 hypothetical protein [Rectinema sp.]HQN03248.1 hypothetical protein [Rectinema sp.]
MVHIKFSKVRIFFFIILILVAAGIVYADSKPSLKDVLPGLTNDEMRNLLASNLLIEDYAKDGSSRFLPSDQIAMTLGESLADRKDGNKYETAYLINDIRFSGNDKLMFFNKLAQINTLSGIMYYSETRGKDTILFDNVYIVDAPGSKTPQQPRFFSQIPERLSLFVHIKDVNFGSIWFSILLFEKEDVFFFLIENVQPMGIGPIRAFDKGDFRIAFSFKEIQEGLLVSSVSYFNPRRLASTFVDVFSAAEKRIRAISSWIAAQAIEAQNTPGHR